MKVVYRDELGTVEQICKSVTFGMGFNGKNALLEIDEENEITVYSLDILQIVEE